MTIYVDSLFDWPIAKVSPAARHCGTRWCHLISDTSEEELHTFARKIGLRQSWYQAGHYDLVPSKRAAAVQAGAVEVAAREFIAAVKRARAARICFNRTERERTRRTMGRKKLEKPVATDVPMPRAIVRRVMTNLKTPGETPRIAELGPLTLIVGPSGSGKTTLIDSVELGLVGASPTRGLGKSAPNLKRALPTKAEALTVAIELSTGESITWSLGRSEKAPIWSVAGGFPLVGSGVLLPAAGTVISVVDALDLLLGYDKNRMLALLDAVPDTPITLGGLTGATGSIARELAVRLEGVLPEDGTVIPSSQFRSVLSTVEALEKEYKLSSTACEAFRVGGLSGEEDVELQRMEAALAAGTGAEFVRAELKKVEAKAAAAQSEIAGCTKLIEEASPGYFAQHNLAASTVDFIHAMVARMHDRRVAEGRCPGCGELHPVEKFEERGQQFSAALAVLESQVGTWGEQIRNNIQRKLDLTAQQTTLVALLTTMGANEAGVDEARLAELRHRRREAQLSIAASARHAVLAGYLSTLGNVREALLTSAVAAVAPAAEVVQRRMNKVLPKGRVARIACDGSKIHIGQQRDKGPIIPTGALSGSERAVFAAALAIALQPTARTAPVSLLVLDEIMFDRRTLKTVLAGLSRAFDSDGGPTQILVCASEWSGKVPAGWTLLEINGEPEENGEGEKSETPANPAENTAPAPTGETSAEPPPEPEHVPTEAEKAAVSSVLDDLM